MNTDIQEERKIVDKKPVLLRKRLHVVSNTHWDREHRHGLQETRCLLIEAVDKLLDIMEADDNFKNFVLDGQSVILQDYLEIKPQNFERLKKLVRQNRLHIGPWYTLPDMQSVAAESLIRNLLVGDRYCRQFGGKMNFGYSIFSFGQIAQLPQIYRGFNIENVILYKGFSPEVLPNAEFIWQAPDGSETLTSRLGNLSRMNFMLCFTIPVILGGDARKNGWEASYMSGNKLAHMIDNNFYNQNAAELQQDIRIRKENILKAVKDVFNSVSDSLAQDTFLAFDGVDYSFPLSQIPEALCAAQEFFGNSVEILHSTPAQYFQDLREELDLKKLFRYCGELRYPPINKVHCGCLSANVELKQKANRAENILLNIAEPFSVFNMILGNRYLQELINKAWEYLLKSHAHDSIHALGVPKIKKDTAYRLDQVCELSESIARRALEGIISRINTDGLNKNELYITVFNPCKFERNGVVNVKVDLPATEHIKSYEIETLTGLPVEHYEYDSYLINIGSVNSENRPKKVACKRLDIDMMVENVPPIGYKTYKLKYEVSGTPIIPHPFSDAVFPSNGIAINSYTLNNGILQVQINDNGTINLTDLETHYFADGIHLLKDTGCSGNMWVHSEPNNNRLFTTKTSVNQVSLIQNSFLSATLRIETVMNIPESLTQDRKQRSKHSVATAIVTDITLKKNSRRIEFKTCLNNRCKDHKLSVVFPTNLQSDVVYSQNAFMITERKVGKPEAIKGKFKNQIRQFPMNSFVDVSDNKQGITLMSRGLQEFEPLHYDNGKIEIELTLLRSVCQTFPLHNDVFLSYENESSQCLGEHSFEYALYVHNSDMAQSDVLNEAQNYQSDMIVVEFGKGREGSLPLEMSLLESTARNVSITAIKKAEYDNSIVLRLSNPFNQPVKEILKFGFTVDRAWHANMNEEKQKQVAVVDNVITAHIEPYQVVTLILESPVLCG